MSRWWVIATGPSAADFDLQQVDPDRTIVIGENWARIPHARVCYHADYKWWREYDVVVRAGFAGERWTASHAAARAFQVDMPKVEFRSGLCREPGKIYLGQDGGQNSSLQALALAWLWGARTRIDLVGVDLGPVAGRSHCFDGRPVELNKHPSNFDAMRRELGFLVRDLVREGVRVVNHSPHSRIPHCASLTLNEAA